MKSFAEDALNLSIGSAALIIHPIHIYYEENKETLDMRSAFNHADGSCDFLYEKFTTSANYSICLKETL